MNKSETYIDLLQKVRTEVELKNTEGNSVDIATLSGSLATPLLDKLSIKAAPNNTRDALLPLMSIFLQHAIDTFMPGIGGAKAFLQDTQTRILLENIALFGFYVAKTIDKQKLAISVQPTKLSNEEIKSINKENIANNLQAVAEITGMNQKDVVNSLYKKGLITKQDLVDLGLFNLIDDTSEKNGN